MAHGITAIITTFNRAVIVPDAINSVFAQTYPISELIVVDDGSSDNTSETVKTAFTNAPFPVRYIYKPNGGMATSLNRGSQESKSEWVAFLDDDDLWAPDHIEKSMNILENTPDCRCIISLREEKGKTQTVPAHLFAPYNRHPLLSNVVVHKKATLVTPFFTSTVGTCVVARVLAGEIGFDSDAGARLDIHFFWRVSENTNIALDLKAHGIGRQFRTSYLSTDDDAPQEIKDKIVLRRNHDEIRMLTKLLNGRDPNQARSFYEMRDNAIIGRVYLYRKAGMFHEARQHLKECWATKRKAVALKESVLSYLKVR